MGASITTRLHQKRAGVRLSPRGRHSCLSEFSLRRGVEEDPKVQYRTTRACILSIISVFCGSPFHHPLCVAGVLPLEVQWTFCGSSVSSGCGSPFHHPLCVVYFIHHHQLPPVVLLLLLLRFAGRYCGVGERAEVRWVMMSERRTEPADELMMSERATS